MAQPRLRAVGRPTHFSPIHQWTRGVNAMPKYVIGREIQEAGRMTPAELTGVAETSREVLRKLGTQRFSGSIAM